MTQPPVPAAFDTQVEFALAASPAEGVGLCLSGGGYRAMLFHLGTVWRLNDAGLLPTLTRVSSVSGGSITAGVLGRAWRELRFDDRGVAGNFQQAVADPILDFAGRTVDVGAVVSGLRTGNVARRVAAAYDRHLFRGATLQDLPADTDGPRFIILATDVGNGVLFRFSRPYMRSWRTHEVRNPTVSLARAVAASSAFPPFLSPAILHLPDAPGGGTRRLTLTDGGVYDNMGIEPVLKNCATVYVSDGGGPFDTQDDPPTGWLLGTVRTLTLIHSQVGRLRRRQVVGALASGRRSGAFWAIDTPPGSFRGAASTLDTPAAMTRALAETKTRLKKLDPATRHRIVNWGYAASDAALRTHAHPDLPEPPGFPLPDGVGPVS